MDPIITAYVNKLLAYHNWNKARMAFRADRIGSEDFWYAQERYYAACAWYEEVRSEP
jgi:hypothetical protein